MLNRDKKRKRRPPGRKERYQHDDILPVLKKIWLAGDQMCSKKLKAAIPEWLPYCEQEHAPISEFLRLQMLSISPATIDRILKPIKIKFKGKGLCGTKPGTLLKNQIPLSLNHWDNNEPGFLEADTVAHCGNSLAGDFVWSITYTDIYTTWTETRAIWNKGSDGVVTQTKDVECSLPFKIKGFDCDNGSEFLNYHLFRYFVDRPNGQPVQFTRSRPYHKNDNAHVEQKNWTHVRHVLGYERFDNPNLVSLINDLYKNELSLYHNHFIPTMKCTQRERINSKYRKRFDKAKTPYERILECNTIPEETKEALRKIHRQNNPFDLKKKIENKLRRIFKHVKIQTTGRAKI
jgi:hypothetical protein